MDFRSEVRRDSAITVFADTGQPSLVIAHWVAVAGKFPAILITVFRLKLLSVTLDGEMLLPKIRIANS